VGTNEGIEKEPGNACGGVEHITLESTGHNPLVLVINKRRILTLKTIPTPPNSAREWANWTPWELRGSSPDEGCSFSAGFRPLFTGRREMKSCTRKLTFRSFRPVKDFHDSIDFFLDTVRCICFVRICQAVSCLMFDLQHPGNDPKPKKLKSMLEMYFETNSSSTIQDEYDQSMESQFSSFFKHQRPGWAFFSAGNGIGKEGSRG
jgi:hypothetical protein